MESDGHQEEYRAGTAGARRRVDHHDLHPCAEQGWTRGPQSARRTGWRGWCGYQCAARTSGVIPRRGLIALPPLYLRRRLSAASGGADAFGLGTLVAVVGDQGAGEFDAVGAAALRNGDQVGDHRREVGEEAGGKRAELGHAHVPEQDAEDADAEHDEGELRPRLRPRYCSDRLQQRGFRFRP